MLNKPQAEQTQKPHNPVAKNPWKRETLYKQLEKKTPHLQIISRLRMTSCF